MPKGRALVGPPGTGKTLMAKAVAGEADVPFFPISGSEFVEMFVGRGAAKVRELFEQASKQAPCLVFIDEIDTIGKRRDSQFGTNDEREQTLNQLLTEMDGFEGNKGVIILAATNRPEVLDPALLRPGRFDRQVRVELPDLMGREAILNVHLRKIKLGEDIDVNLIARMTAGASGAQLANIVNEAALRAVRMGKDHVTTSDLAESVETIIAGAEKKNAILSEEEKRIVAYHEIGHALVAAKQSGAAPVQKITIVPRTSGALGYTMQVEEDDKYLVSKTDAYQKIEVLCGGRAAEEVVFNSITTGASNDIERATEIARNMVTRYGMSDNFGMMALQTGGNSYLGEPGRSTCSPETARLVDEEIKEIIAKAYKRAKDILVENRDKLDELAEFLLEKETISGEEFMEILEEKSPNWLTVQRKASAKPQSCLPLCDSFREKHPCLAGVFFLLTQKLSLRIDQHACHVLSKTNRRPKKVSGCETLIPVIRNDQHSHQLETYQLSAHLLQSLDRILPSDPKTRIVKATF